MIHADLPPLIVRHAHNLRAQPCYGVELGLWRMLGDHNRAGDAQAARIPGHALGGIAGAGSVDAMRKLLFACKEHGVARATQLEGVDGLQAFQL
jgi:hypothetical protein